MQAVCRQRILWSSLTSYYFWGHMQILLLEPAPQELQSYQSHFAWHGRQLF
jgi:hypothetical protein